MEDSERMTVLMIEPERFPKTVEIDSGLRSLQKAVGGDIEAVYPWADNVAIIVNEEGKINGMPLNRAVRDGGGEVVDIMAGNMLIVGLGEENFTSLSQEQLMKYERLFHQPELFLRLSNNIMVIPMPDADVHRAEKAAAKAANRKHRPDHDSR